MRTSELSDRIMNALQDGLYVRNDDHKIYGTKYTHDLIMKAIKEYLHANIKMSAF